MGKIENNETLVLFKHIYDKPCDLLLHYQFGKGMDRAGIIQTTAALTTTVLVNLVSIRFEHF